jgi:MYXO-CTERM domain-containing protein
MATVHEFIGRSVVRVVWWRFGRQIQVAGVAALFLAGLAGYLLSRRRPPEG